MSRAMPDDIETLASLYALGLLQGAELESFEDRLRDEAPSRSLTAGLAEAAAALAGIAPGRRPPPELKDLLLSRVRAEAPPRPEPRVALSPGVAIVYAGRMDWRETGLPGVRVKPLHLDAGRKYASSLVSMAAGSVYPRHWHAQVEELLMLSGSISVSGHRLDPGDYCRAEPGTVHDEVRAETDCTFLALAALDNEFRPAL